jgi:hypothetical protein
MKKNKPKYDLTALLRDRDRLDWLADPANAVGNVLLPTEAVTANPHSLRAAIDAAMAGSLDPVAVPDFSPPPKKK